jgi:formate-dependent nitrite reductase membrane component NrfD
MLEATHYTLHPEWGMYIVFYFFLGGIAAGVYFMAAIIELVGSQEDRALARTAYYIAFPLVVICGILLILDLGRPERFWHMLLVSNTRMIAFKYWSPMSVGAWALLIFGGFTFFSFLDAWGESRRIRRGETGERLIYTGFLGKGFALVGSLFGFFIAGYTGALLTATNQPLWSESHLLGALFLASSASTGMAVLLFLHSFSRHRDSIEKLERVDNWAMILELIFLGIFITTVVPGVVNTLTGGGFSKLFSGVSPLMTSHYGRLLWFGVVLGGIILPLILHIIPILGARVSGALAALLVLVGGFLLRYVIIMAPQGLYLSFLKNWVH